MKTKYLNKPAIEKKYSNRQKLINGITYGSIGLSLTAALGTYILDSTPQDFTNKEAALYSALVVAVPIVADITNTITSKINKRNKIKALDNIREIPLEITNPEKIAL